jgi:hypothetical protein
MEALQTSETLVNSYQSTRRYNPKDSHLQQNILNDVRFEVFTVAKMNLLFWAVTTCSITQWFGET